MFCGIFIMKPKNGSTSENPVSIYSMVEIVLCHPLESYSFFLHEYITILITQKQNLFIILQQRPWSCQRIISCASQVRSISLLLMNHHTRKPKQPCIQNLQPYLDCKDITFIVDAVYYMQMLFYYNKSCLFSKQTRYIFKMCTTQ